MCASSGTGLGFFSHLNPANFSQVHKGYTDLVDQFGISYRFKIYDINEYPNGFNSVYAFAKEDMSFEGSKIFSPIYIGKTRNPPVRFYSHEKKLPAINLGANRLLLHSPSVHDFISYEDAEERLIRAYKPVLNKEYNSI